MQARSRAMRQVRAPFVAKLRLSEQDRLSFEVDVFPFDRRRLRYPGIGQEHKQSQRIQVCGCLLCAMKACTHSRVAGIFLLVSILNRFTGMRGHSSDSAPWLITACVGTIAWWFRWQRRLWDRWQALRSGWHWSRTSVSSPVIFVALQKPGRLTGRPISNSGLRRHFLSGSRLPSRCVGRFLCSQCRRAAQSPLASVPR